jgi:sugar lactone lactonase YvrE
MQRTVFAIALIAGLVLAAQNALAQLAPGEVRMILDLPSGDSPEGVAVDADSRAVYIGNRRPIGNSAVSSDILTVNHKGKVDSHFASLPPAPAGSFGLLGLATYQGNIFAAFDSDDDASGIYRVKKNGNRVEQVAGTAGILTPNALTRADDGNFYVTDSKAGAIWRFNPDNIKQPAKMWLQHELLAPDPQNPLGLTDVGANGIAFVDGSLFVANTGKNLLARVEIGPGGLPGVPTVAAGGDLFGPLTTIDGIAATADGSGILAAIPGFAVLSAITGASFAPVVNVDLATGAVTPAALEDPNNPIFETPTSVALAPGAHSLFVTNSAFSDDDDFGVPQPGPSIVEIGLADPGKLGLDTLRRVTGPAGAVPETESLAMCIASVLLFGFRRMTRQTSVKGPRPRAIMRIPQIEAWHRPNS